MEITALVNWNWLVRALRKRFLRITKSRTAPDSYQPLQSPHSSTAVPDWIGPLAPWLRHVHLHNNSGGWDLHDPLGEGNIPMEQVLDTLLARCPAATYTIENMNCAPSLDWLAARGYLGEITL